MKCKKCKRGDLHFIDEIWRFSLRHFWRKPKTVGYIFVCDNCGHLKEVRIGDKFKLNKYEEISSDFVSDII